MVSYNVSLISLTLVVCVCVRWFVECMHASGRDTLWQSPCLTKCCVLVSLFPDLGLPREAASAFLTHLERQEDSGADAAVEEEEEDFGEAEEGGTEEAEEGASEGGEDLEEGVEEEEGGMVGLEEVEAEDGTLVVTTAVGGTGTLEGSREEEGLGKEETAGETVVAMATEEERMVMMGAQIGLAVEGGEEAGTEVIAAGLEVGVAMVVEEEEEVTSSAVVVGTVVAVVVVVVVAVATKEEALGAISVVVVVVVAAVAVVDLGVTSRAVATKEGDMGETKAVATKAVDSGETLVVAVEMAITSKLV